MRNRVLERGLDEDRAHSIGAKRILVDCLLAVIVSNARNFAIYERNILKTNIAA